MDWIIYALIAPILYTLTNFVDKHIVANEVSDYRGMPIFGTIVGLIGGTVIWAAMGFQVLPAFDAFLIMLSGALIIWNSVIYYKLIFEEDVSKVALFFQTVPIFVLILSYVFLKETITTQQFVGFIIVLASAMGISAKKVKGEFKLTNTFWLVMLMNLVIAISAILAKLAISANSFSAILAYESWGLGIGGAILYIFSPNVRKTFRISYKQMSTKAIILIFASEIVFVIAKAFTFSAYALGPTALVSVMGGIQGLFGIMLGYAFTKLLPKYFDEDLSKRTILIRAMWAILIILGIFLIGI